MADEQKKLHPDCWKRKRSLSSASATATSQAGGLPHPLPHTPTHRLQHPFSFLTAAGGADHRYTLLLDILTTNSGTPICMIYRYPKYLTL